MNYTFLIILCFIIAIYNIGKDFLIEYLIIRHNISYKDAKNLYSFQNLLQCAKKNNKANTHANLDKEDAWVKAMQEKINNEEKQRTENETTKN